MRQCFAGPFLGGADASEEEEPEEDAVFNNEHEDSEEEGQDEQDNNIQIQVSNQDTEEEVDPVQEEKGVVKMEVSEGNQRVNGAAESMRSGG